MWKRSESWWARYGVAILSIVAATGLRVLLRPVLGDGAPFATVFVAIVFSAWYGGFGPTILTSILGLPAAIYFLMPANGPPASGGSGWLGIFFYVAISLGIATLGGLMRRARRRIWRQMDELHSQREQLRATLRSIGDAVVVTDGEGRVTLLNPVAEALTGWSAVDAVGLPLDDVFHIVNEQTRATVESPVARVLREGVVVGLANHTVLIAKDGIQRPIDDSAAPIRNHEGQLVGVVFVFRDIAKRKEAEEATARLAAIVQSSDDAIVGKSLDGMITSWNAGAERLYGYTAAEIVGRPFSVLVPSERVKEVERTVGLLARGERIDHFETTRRRKDGRLIDVSVSYSPLRDHERRL